jgi:hypothetical protein
MVDADCFERQLLNFRPSRHQVAAFTGLDAFQG